MTTAFQGEYVNMVPSVHLNTNNISAIKLHHILRELGVKNNKFFLTIYDTDLMYIDPFDPNLSKEMQLRVWREAKNNYWYYVRELVRINVPGGKIQFQFHRGNLALLFLLQNNINVYIELPRQTTKTGTSATNYSYVWGIKSINSKIGLLSKDDESSTANLKHIKNILHNLPPYMQPLNPKRDIDNTDKIESAITKNIIIARAPGRDTMSAINKARGSSEENDWKDEINFTPYGKLVILNSGPAWGTAAQLAAKNGVPYGRLFSSTPGILGDPVGDYMFNEFIPQCMQFDEKLFYDQPSTEAIKSLVYANSQNDFVKVRFTYKQLGYGEDYYERQKRLLNNDQSSIDREVNLKWSTLGTDSPFDQEKLNRIYQNLKSPIYTVVLQNTYALKFFEKPDWTKKYVISIDPSGLTGNDYASIVVIDPETFGVIATLQSNARSSNSNTTRFTYAIIDIMSNIFKNAIAVIERNNMGVAIIDNIITIASSDIISRLYSSDYEPGGKNKQNNELSGYDSLGNHIVGKINPQNIVYGFQTTEVRRQQMYGEIIEIILSELYGFINDVSIYDQMNNIIRDNKGRLNHRNGKHDDMLFAYMIGLWVLMYSKVIYKQFGYKYNEIRPISIMDEEKSAKIARERDNRKTFAEQIEENLVNSENNIFYMPTQKEIHQRFEEELIAHRNPEYDQMNMSGEELANFLYGETSQIVPYSEEEYKYDSAEVYVQNRKEEYDAQKDTTAMTPFEQREYMKNISAGLSEEIAIRNAKRAENLRKGREKRAKNIEMAKARMAKENNNSNIIDGALNDLISAWG